MKNKFIFGRLQLHGNKVVYIILLFSVFSKQHLKRHNIKHEIYILKTSTHYHLIFPLHSILLI